jgi:nucleoside 2-deoxyribosyltransferase
MKVYLAGTITKDPRTHAWRGVAQEQLALRGHKGLSPLRKKDISSFSADGLKSSNPPSLFVERDEEDIKKSDMILVYTLGIETLERQSIGTWAELGLARAYRKPIIVVADHPMVKDYPFVVKWAAKVVPTLEEALDLVDWLDE